jgi:hypothetical protein
MPIKGLTDRGASFPEIGRIRKGAKKTRNRPGPDLQWFRVEFDEFEKEADAKFKEIYGDQPRLLRIVLPLPTSIKPGGEIDNPNWDAWREAYLAGGMIHRCDGERVWYHINPMTGEHEVRNGEPETICPCATSPDNKTPIGYYINQKGKKTPVFCEYIGRLQVILPELERFAYLTLITQSFYDIINLSQQMNGYIQIHGNLQGIPFIVQRKPAEIPAPIGENGRKVRITKWMLSIETDPDWVKAKLESMRQAAIPQLPEGSPEAPGEFDEAEFRDVPQEHPPLEQEVSQDVPDHIMIHGKNIALSDLRQDALMMPEEISEGKYRAVCSHFGIDKDQSQAIYAELGNWADALIHVVDKFGELENESTTD